MGGIDGGNIVRHQVYGSNSVFKPHPKTKTNADHIRSMSDEELAKLLLDGCRGSKCDDQPQNEWGSVNCFECRMNWLQQPAEEDDHDERKENENV